MGFRYVENGKSYLINYQDVWIHGELVEPGARECVLRYTPIYEALKKLNRPLKVLDIGANMGYFTIRLAEQLEGVFVAMEGDSQIADLLVKIVKMSRNRQVFVMEKMLSLHDYTLIQEEYFDVILALSIVHHLNEPFQQVFEQLTKACDVLILEHPTELEMTYNQERVNREPLDLSRFEKKLLVETPSGLTGKQLPNRPTWWIQCNHKNSQKKEEPSVSLKFFKQLGGTWPNQKTVAQYTSNKDPSQLIPAKSWPSIFDTLI